MVYLCDKRILFDDEAVVAFFAANDKREVLKAAREAKMANNGSSKIVRRNVPAICANGSPLNFTKLQVDSILAVGREIVFLMKFIMAIVVVMCVLFLLVLAKK